MSQVFVAPPVGEDIHYIEAGTIEVRVDGVIIEGVHHLLAGKGGFVLYYPSPRTSAVIGGERFVRTLQRRGVVEVLVEGNPVPAGTVLTILDSVADPVAQRYRHGDGVTP